MTILAIFKRLVAAKRGLQENLRSDVVFRNSRFLGARAMTNPPEWVEPHLRDLSTLDDPPFSARHRHLAQTFTARHCSSHCSTSLIFPADLDLKLRPGNVHPKLYHQQEFQPDRAARSGWLRNVNAARAERANRASGTPDHVLGSGYALERQITM